MSIWICGFRPRPPSNADLFIYYNYHVIFGRTEEKSVYAGEISKAQATQPKLYRAVQRCQSKGGAWLDSDLQILGLWGFFASMQENQANKRAVVEIRYLETQ